VLTKIAGSGGFRKQQGEAEPPCSILNHHTLWSETITLLLLVQSYQIPTHCPEQLVETEKLRWRWGSELVNDRESESFGLFGGSESGERELKQHTDRYVLVVREEK